MLNNKELKIGNYVYIGITKPLSNLIYEISGITPDVLTVKLKDNNQNNGEDTSVFSSDIIPIDITNDLLLSSGFVQKSDSEFDLYINKHFINLINDTYASNTIGRDWYIHVDNEVHDSVFSADLQYFHQLQNAIYFSCQAELKTITKGINNGK